MDPQGQELLSQRAGAGLAVGVLSMVGALTLALVIRNHAFVSSPGDVFRTLLGFGFAAAAASVGTGVGGLIASSNRMRGPGEFAATTILGIAAIIGMTMAIAFTGLYFGSSTRAPRSSLLDGTSDLEYLRPPARVAEGVESFAR